MKEQLWSIRKAPMNSTGTASMLWQPPLLLTTALSFPRHLFALPLHPDFRNHSEKLHWCFTSWWHSSIAESKCQIGHKHWCNRTELSPMLLIPFWILSSMIKTNKTHLKIPSPYEPITFTSPYGTWVTPRLPRVYPNDIHTNHPPLLSFCKSEQSPCLGGPQNTLSTFHQSEHKPLLMSNSLSNPSGLRSASSSLFAGWFDERGLKKINLIPIAALPSKKKKRQVIPNTGDCNR